MAAKKTTQIKKAVKTAVKTKNKKLAVTPVKKIVKPTKVTVKVEPKKPSYVKQPKTLDKPIKMYAIVKTIKAMSTKEVAIIVKTGIKQLLANA